MHANIVSPSEIHLVYTYNQPFLVYQKGVVILKYVMILSSNDGFHQLVDAKTESRGQIASA